MVGSHARCRRQQWIRAVDLRPASSAVKHRRHLEDLELHASIIDRSPERVAGGGVIRMLWIGPAAQADSRHLTGRGCPAAA
jgi:hypothetical protein